MLIHGKQDQRAPFEHAERMKQALEAAGKTVVWYVESAEPHGFRSEKNRADMYTELLAFFEKNIGK